jgi:hypothetical protein
VTRTEAIEKLTDIYANSGMYDRPRESGDPRRHAELAIEHLPIQLEPELVSISVHMVGKSKAGV